MLNIFSVRKKPSISGQQLDLYKRKIRAKKLAYPDGLKTLRFRKMWKSHCTPFFSLALEKCYFRVQTWLT